MNYAALAILVLVPSASLAADFEIVCSNPGTDYFVTYDIGAKVAVIDPDSQAVRQRVIATSDDAGRVVILDLGAPGMASALRLDQPMRNDIFSDGELVQSDACRPA